MENSMNISNIAVTQDSDLEPDVNLLKITAQIEKNLLTTSNWSIFIAVVGFILTGLMFIGGIMMFVLNKYSSEYQDFQAIPIPHFMTFIGFLYVIFSIVYFLLSLFLILFALKTRKGLQSKSQQELEKGFLNMKRLALFTGIMTIISIVCSLFIPIIIGYFSFAKQIGGM